MEFKELVEKVEELNRDNGEQWTAEWQLAWIIEELGEVSKELIKLRKLPGRFNTEKTTNGLSEELGDLLYGVISLANTYEIDLEKSLQNSIEKFSSRSKNTSG